MFLSVLVSIWSVSRHFVTAAYTCWGVAPSARLSRSVPAVISRGREQPGRGVYDGSAASRRYITTWSITFHPGYHRNYGCPTRQSRVYSPIAIITIVSSFNDRSSSFLYVVSRVHRLRLRNSRLIKSFSCRSRSRNFSRFIRN